MSGLGKGKPRRFADHRRKEARPYNAAYAAIAERYQPPDRLGRALAGIAADLLEDYEALRRSKRSKPSQWQTASLFLGALRAVQDGNGRNGHAATTPADIIRAMTVEADGRRG